MKTTYFPMVASAWAITATALLPQAVMISSASADGRGHDPTGTSNASSALGGDFLLEGQYRRNGYRNAYYTQPPNERSYGEYWTKSETSIDHYTTIEDHTKFNSTYLQNELNELEWDYSNPAGTYPYSNGSLRIGVASGFLEYPASNPKTTFYQGRIEQVRVRISATSMDHPPLHERFLKITKKAEYSINQIWEIVHTEPFDIDLPSGSMTTDWIELKAPMTDGQDTRVELIPLEAAPEVLAVNSDFDEGRINPVTHYAIPDCDDMPNVDQKTGGGNTKLELDAERNHLDGTFTQGEDVVKDLHKGWFGAKPNTLDNAVWAGANVTIRKIDKIDDETGHKESGQVRFYAKFNGGYYGISPYDFQTLQPVNLVSAGVNLRPNEGVYGASSTIPDGAEFYMEGVRPGKITLEWRFQKDDIDVKREQTFKVETKKSVAQWQEEVRYQIRLQTKVKSGTEVDVALYHPSNGFRNANATQDNVRRIIAIYDFYQQLFKQMPEKFMWAGMAKVAAAPIYAGMSDLNTWWQLTGDVGVEVFIEGLLLDGQKKIFTDMVWAHRAYKASGILALKHAQSESPNATNYEAWISMDSGIQSNNSSMIFEANGTLLRREQQEVVQQNYDIVQSLWMRQPPAHPNINGGVTVAVDANGLANAGEWLSANSNNNPLPGGPGFRSKFPGGRLDYFDDRWAWTSNATSGMLEIWTGASTSTTGYDEGRRASENGKTIKAAASDYSYDPSGLP